MAGVLGNCLLAFIVQVNVRSDKWEPMTFTASLDDRVKKIHEHVRSKTKVPVQEQVLQLGGQTLKPLRKLSSYCIDTQTIHLTLRVVKPSDEELSVFLVEAGFEGQTHLLQVRRSSSVAEVKKMIETKTAVRPGRQVVICNGKKLKDGKTMANYGIREGAFLYLAFPCIGE